MEDTKSVFNRMDGSSLGRMLIGLESNPPTKPVPKFINEMYDSPEVSEPSEYMTPVVRKPFSSLTVKKCAKYFF